MPWLRPAEVPRVQRNPPGGVQLQGPRVLPVVHGTADVRHRREPHRARSAAFNPASSVGADLPVPLETKARAGARSLPLGHGELLGRLTQIFVETVQGFYVRRAAHEGAIGAKTGAVTAVQRASSDMRLNPHLHTIALDGAWSKHGHELVARGQAARSLGALDT